MVRRMLLDNEAEPLEFNEDDSIFVPIADLFSLLSLTLIYLVLTFGQPVPIFQQELIVSTSQGPGLGKPIDPGAAYVSLSKLNNSACFEITRNGITVDKLVPFSANNTEVPESWMLETIAHEGVQPATIYVFLSEKENDFVIKALFTDTQRFLRKKFRNVRTAF